MTKPTPSEVAQCALNFYNSPALPKHKGKPKIGSEFTVYSAIVVSSSNDLWVVSCATGSKCCAAKADDDGLVLHDSHAEVLAKRALVRVLWSEVKRGLDIDCNDCVATCVCKAKHDGASRSRSLLECYVKNGNRMFRLKKELTLHMYISDSPCGDASIYELSSSNGEGSDGMVTSSFTGAKIVVSKSILSTENNTLSQHLSTPDSSVTIARENEQIIGMLRLKSGRSNIPQHLRSMSHCCSDKICRWMICGLQGRMLTKYIDQPIILSSICVSRDPQALKQTDSQLLALQRALGSRVESSLTNMHAMLQETEIDPNVRDAILYWTGLISSKRIQLAIVDDTFSCSKSISDVICATDNIQKHGNFIKDYEDQLRKRLKIGCRRKVSAAGISFNWDIVSNCVEITIGKTGRLQGGKPKTEDDKNKFSSRLSKRSIFEFAKACCDELSKEQNSFEEKIKKSHQDNDILKRFPGNEEVVIRSLSYRFFKDFLTPDYINMIRKTILTQGSLSGWVVSNNDDFSM